MARTKFTSVDEYIATQPDSVRAILQRVRGIIRTAAPDADEGISYQIPVYTLRGKLVLHFAGWKAHYSIYPATDGLLDALGDELSSHVVSKGTIRFPLSEPVPERLITRIATFRAKVASDRADVGAVGPKARTASQPNGRARVRP